MLADSDAFVLLFALLFKVVFGAICAGIANGRGRNAAGWFFVGLFLDCLGLILVLVLPDLKVQQAERMRHEQENRRLREALAKERQVADQRHGHVERRLGVHDQAIGVDTSSPPALADSAAAPALPASASGARWYYARGKERMGPVSEETVRHLLQAGAIRGDTLVWREGMADWTKAAGVDEVRGDVA
jgi:hypothetical protein